ncbi:4-hydroxybutyrate dehydrogenase/sulfolactaldehyde 3-reductase [Pseudomonas citronellolis]|nr:4-hydroxybutyrate dehydrogenase/sulfolactaldehyde 3-reductase [Pseudomonas citronellolis]MCP1667997.1 4-hydroxybutyrate dehydrogenase/sulfolactaldehyde 3-reductase [Pseudomonas citronellolis]MCP1699157.1 4-hydroxybutyrate dehydrogenase/sulfolactaldehyde 3-reductase [Pseudomonas citronellolis]MCP1705688.1 4-hydroxybutyrate dehydrogenase/sulfolactaldehyde 3-reductase [Pseudomonas citronellolis]MCP1799721.1 4-hydroxybutyrate dehydrogenase/sulfolactaldehyde 3-reductase [Pseudomonas citronellolis
MKVGFIGLGRMGYALASNLLRNGVELIVHDIQADPVKKLAAQGAETATDVKGLAERADIVFTMLPGPRQVREVILGQEGLLAWLAPGKRLIELSTIDTDTVDELCRAARARDIRFADAPVGRLAAHADRGESLFMLGAEGADYPALEALLLKMGSTVLHCGEPGAGTRMKLINNLMVLCYCQLNSEALVLAKALGMDVKKTFEVLTGTTASNGQLKEKWPVKVLKGDLTPGFDIALGFKDLTLACQAAQSSGVSLPVGNLVRNMFQLARHAGKDGLDTSSLTDYWAQANGVDLIRF